jgi:hypothetical protein
MSSMRIAVLPFTLPTRTMRATSFAFLRSLWKRAKSRSSRAAREDALKSHDQREMDDQNARAADRPFGATGIGRYDDRILDVHVLGQVLNHGRFSIELWVASQVKTCRGGRQCGHLHYQRLLFST